MAHSGSVAGVSFDGLAVSGVVNELLNVMTVFQDANLRILVDLGGDVTHRAEMPLDTDVLPAWVTPLRLAVPIPAGYDAALVEEATASVLRGTPVAAVPAFQKVCRELSSAMVAAMEREAVQVLIVENGTLPDNPLYTEALYLAIEDYGARHGLGKYVMWRDHDLMWSTEPHYYGSFPYEGVRRPVDNRHIHYCVATDWMARRFQSWAKIQPHVISNRFRLPPEPADRSAAAATFRKAYAIPSDAILIARCTRVIREKSIARDLRLIQSLQRRLADAGDPRRIHLFVTGPTNEDPPEYSRLVDLARTIGIEQQITWANALSPFNSAFAPKSDGTFSVADLLMAADLSSFLTTYDYEGFGNPPGEAMACGVPYIVTSYELYHDVYGKKGALAPVLPIGRDTPADDPMPEDFVDGVLRLLRNREYRDQVVAKNRDVCRRFFSLDALAEQMQDLFGEVLSPKP